MFTYEITKDRLTGEDIVVITGCSGDETRLEIPDRIRQLPVTQIAPYAFADKPITSLSLPETVTHMGNYALYRCSRLEEIVFYGKLKNTGAGAFTGCHHIRRLSVYTEEDETSGLRDVLMEIPEELQVEVWVHGYKALLLFPEYFEEGVENTPARIIEHHTHGSGLLYRNCFVNRILRFQEYDERFPYALGQEREAFTLRLAAARLCFPYSLSQNHRKTYENYLTGHFETALTLFRKTHEHSMVSYLMNLHHQLQKPRRPDFSL